MKSNLKIADSLKIKLGDYLPHECIEFIFLSGDEEVDFFFKNTSVSLSTKILDIFKKIINSFKEKTIIPTDIISDKNLSLSADQSKDFINIVFQENIDEMIVFKFSINHSTLIKEIDYYTMNRHITIDIKI